MSSDPERRQRSLESAGVFVDARAGDGEEDGDLVGGHERLVELGLEQAEGFHAHEGASVAPVQHAT